jgi:HlyD family secretion protein
MGGFFMGKNKKQKTEEKNTPFYSKGLAMIKKYPWRAAGILLVVVVLLIVLIQSIFSSDDLTGDLQTSTVKRGDLIAIVGATGVVEPNQSVELDWETTGRVESINVSINDQVEKGDVLAVLADNTLPQSVILAKADLVNAQRELADLLNSTTDTALAYTDLLDAESELRTAKDDRDQWNYNNATWNRVYEARNAFLNREEILKDTQSTFDILSGLDENDGEYIEVLEALDSARFERDKALRNLNYILGKAYDRQVAEDFADYDVALSKMQDAQREWERVKDGPNADDIVAAEARVAASEATVSQSWIEAPFSGTVTKAFPKVGDQISIGRSAFRIDDISELYVDVEISEVDINRIAVGQKAELSFDAILGDNFDAEVVEVSKVGIDTGNGVDFLVTLKILEQSEMVRPGMTAAVNIIVNEINDVLYVPNRAVRLMENVRVVFVLKDGQLVEVPVEFGSSSDVNSEIISGDIQEGDQVVLNPPMELITGGPPAFVR